jgi:hypothetical protein
MFSRRVEKLYDLPKADEKFRDLLRVHEFRDRFAVDFYQAFQRHQEIYTDASDE